MESSLYDSIIPSRTKNVLQSLFSRLTAESHLKGFARAVLAEEGGDGGRKEGAREGNRHTDR